MTGTGDRGVRISVCDSCGAGFFPLRLLCPRCGGSEWTPRLVAGGTVRETTIVRRSVGGPAGEVWLATVRLDTGQHVVARLDRPVAEGERVDLRQLQEAVYACGQRSA